MEADNGAPSVSTHWIFLRGLVRESAHWDDFPYRFAEILPDVWIHTIDLPGNGIHWRQASPSSLVEMMESAHAEALALMSERLAGQPYFLFSISLGSMVAVEWAHRYSDEIAGAVLVNTSLRDLSPLHKRLSCRIWPLLARIVASRDAAKREELILDLTSSRKPPLEDFIENRVVIQRRHPVRIMNVFRQLWAAACYRPPQEKPSTPLLLLNSLGDRMVDPDCTRAIASH
ncbi:MAG: alpha/beta hydrolase, partial [Methylococcaceae bacterium]|nr:alpha/beta hydrolase [Methylococcaceae bacterium]